MFERVQTHIQWRLERRAAARLHRRAPNDYTLRGVRLDLGQDWITPTLRAAIYDAGYETPEAEIVEATVRSTDRVLEIGCGIGFVATIASRIACDVRGYDANPAMVAASQRTLEDNWTWATISAAVLQRRPSDQTLTFYVHSDFWTSSLTPSDGAEEIHVPVLDFAGEILDQDTSYLILDIEGAETELLLEPMPPSVRAICVESHPSLVGDGAVAEMLMSLSSQGFAVNSDHSRPPVFYLER